MAPLPKTLVIGSLGHSHVTCVSWKDAVSTNIVDFDVVVINCRPLTEEFLKAVRFNFFDPIRKGLSRLLVSKGRIITLGVERIEVDLDKQFSKSTYSWSPIAIHTHAESGNTVKLNSASFPKLLSHLEKWSYWYVIPNSCITSDLSGLTGRSGSYERETQVFAENREGRALAGAIRFNVTHDQSKERRALGWVTYLPDIEKLTDAEAVNLVLEDLLGLPQVAALPDWVQKVDMPIVPKIVADIEVKKREIQRLQLEIDVREREKADLESHKRLLFSTGHELETTFARCLEMLGGTITPAKYSQEEFILKYGEGTFLVECKGVGKSVALTHVRQLSDYMLKYEEDEGISGKGILFGNAWKDLRPEERGQPKTLFFPDNVVARAKAFGIALVSSQGFFGAFCGFLAGNISGHDVLELITTSVGVVDFSRLTK